MKMTFIHMKSFIYGHIHPCRWIKITLSFKLQIQSSKHKFYTHAQAIFLFKSKSRSQNHMFLQQTNIILNPKLTICSYK
jgi:hypothetical protein